MSSVPDAMRKKQLRLLLTFSATTDAMAMEVYCTQHALPGRLIPVPSAISAGCGMCWSAPPDLRAQLTDAAAHAGSRIEGFHLLTI